MGHRRIASVAACRRRQWNRLRLAGVAALGLAALVAAPAGAGPVLSGAHPWVVVLCNFENERVDAGSVSSYQQIYTETGPYPGGALPYNLPGYWSNVSFGQLSLAGSVVADGSHADSKGWYTVPESRDTWEKGGRAQKIIDCANAASADVNYSEFYGVMAIFPEGEGSLAAPLSATATSMTAQITPDAPYFPKPPFLMSIEKEDVQVTAVSGNTFTIVRGVAGTTAVAHASGAAFGVPGDYGEAGGAPGPWNVQLTTGTFRLATVIFPNESNLTGAAHETGHGFGYDHTRTISYSTNDYGDATDDMSAFDNTYEDTSLGTPLGGAVLGSEPGTKGPGLDAIDLDIQGWIPGSRHFSLDNSTPHQSTITLHALSDPNALSSPSSQYLEARVPAAVKIEDQSPKGPGGSGFLHPTDPPTCSGTGYHCTSSDYYTVEYRQQEGWDSGFPASAVVLHLHSSTPAPNSGATSYWIDQVPGGAQGATLHAHTGLLYAGDEYADPADHAFIAVNAIDPGDQDAQVTLGSAKIPTHLAYTGDVGGKYGQAITLAANLTVAASAAPVPNEPLTFTLGSQSCKATTDLTGHAACSVLLSQNADLFLKISATFGGDAAYESAPTAASSFTSRTNIAILHPLRPIQLPTKLVYSGATSGTVGAVVKPAADLTSDGAPISDATVTFSVGTGTCQAETSSTGHAACSIVLEQTGELIAKAAFSGQPAYAASSASTAFTATGSLRVLRPRPGT